MRPVENGTAPDIEFKKYQEAETYLEERLGAYCSFCEFPIIHVPEVEHKEAKSKGFFSTWMSVFKDDLKIKKVLIEEFKGTKV